MKHLKSLLTLALLCSSLMFAENLAPENLKHTEYHENGQLRKAFLKTPTVVNEFECMNWIRFYPNGGLKYFQTKNDIEIVGIPIPARSRVFLKENGSIDFCWFSKKQIVQGFPCPRGMSTTGFYETGEMRLCFPTQPVVVDSFECKRGGLCGVYLYKNGKLKKGWLRKGLTIDDVYYKKGTQIELDKNGQVVATRRKSILEKAFPMFY